MARLTGTLLGVVLAVDAPAAVLAAVARRLPPAWQELPAEGPGAAGWTVTADGDRLAVRRGAELLGSWDDGTAVPALVGDLELWAAEHTTETVVVHAGVVACGGRALVLPGRSMQGKSTLTVALLRAGADFLSDEYALLGVGGVGGISGTVRAYPRPVSMRARADQDGPPVRIEAAALGARVEPGPVPVAVVAALCFDASAGGLELTAMAPGETTLALIENAVAARTQPGLVLRTCAAVARGATGVRGVRGDADAAARELLALLAG